VEKRMLSRGELQLCYEEALVWAEAAMHFA
jgi:hypothetical protein